MKNLFFCAVAIILIACNPDKFSPHSYESLKVAYSNDSIIIHEDDIYLKLIEKEGKYYTEEGKLFLSTSNDTTVVCNKWDIIYVIKCVPNKDTYITSCYQVKGQNDAILLSEYCYDSCFHIKGIKINTGIEYY